jgi:hypothetical protein
MVINWLTLPEHSDLPKVIYLERPKVRDLEKAKGLTKVTTKLTDLMTVKPKGFC